MKLRGVERACHVPWLFVMIGDFLLMSGNRQPGQVVAVKIDDWPIDVPVR